MTILFSTFGSLGDIHPYLALALEAQGRGHRPIVATAPKYRAKVEALGVEFRAIRPDLPGESQFGPLAKQVMDLKDGPRFLFQELLNPSVRANFADLLEAGEDADLIVTHPAALGGPLAARKLGKKWMSSALAPISLWSKHDLPTLPTMTQLDFLRVLGPAWGALMYGIGRMATRKWVSEVVKLSEELGLPNTGHPMLEGQFSPMGTLALFSKHFAKPQRDWPANTTATGFAFYDATGFVDEAKAGANWQAWIANGDAPLVFTLGSSAVHDGDAFFQASRSYNRDAQTRAIYLGAFVDEAANDSRALNLPYAPYSQLFPRCRAVVHQGGIGTTAQALRAGVPQIIVPYAHDQPDNARRIKNLGVGWGVSRKRYEAGKAGHDFEILNDAFQTISREPRELGERIRAENGPRAACEAMEQVLGV